VQRQPDGSVIISADEVADLKELFDYLLTGRRLAAGWGSASQARYMRFMELRRKLLADGNS
jgi:hypothetical protein